MYKRWVRQSLYSYNYSSARAFTLALQHVMEGPDFWRQNIDMVAVREELGRVASGEKMEDVILPDDLITRNGRESRLHRLFRLISLNGFLLPGWMIIDRTIKDNKNIFGDAYRIFRFRRVLYTAPNSNWGYVAEYDRKRFWEEYKLARRTAREFQRRFEELRAAYNKASPDLTSERFWREVYDGNDTERLGGQSRHLADRI